jgi:hypothetical protein
MGVTQKEVSSAARKAHVGTYAPATADQPMMISKMNTQMNTQSSKMNTQMSWHHNQHDHFRLRGSSAEDGAKAAALAKKQEPAECNVYAQILNLQTYGAPPLSRMPFQI